MVEYYYGLPCKSKQNLPRVESLRTCPESSARTSDYTLVINDRGALRLPFVVKELFSEKALFKELVQPSDS